MSRLQDLTENILPQIARSGRLGSEVTFVKCILDESASGDRQFASTVCFVVAVFESGGKTQEYPLLIKYNMDNEAVRNWLKLNYQFRNEVIVYERILPFLSKYNSVTSPKTDIFPKYFYGSACLEGDPSKYIIILEDLRNVGYTMSPEVLDLDFAHCALAFSKLGIFHSSSFAAKQLKSKDFFDIANSIIETKLFDEKDVEWNYLYAGSVTRAAEPLLKQGVNTEQIQSFRDKLQDSKAYMEKVLAVQEPMAVICHGDFCRNNVLYKYENKTPIDIKFFDLATARYGSPMLDFSFFFFLNCSEESRKLHRDDYLNIYHDSLSSAIPNINIPSLDDFKEEFLKKAVYGFLLCSFFKPAMMDPVPFNPAVEVQKSEEDRAIKVLKNAGDEGTKVISNMLLELIDMGCAL